MFISVAMLFSPGDSVLASNLKEAPPVRAEKWFNAGGDKKITMAGLHGKVILIFFWSENDSNCQKDIPTLNDWYVKYRPRGLEIIGVHSFEWAYDASDAVLADKILSYHIEFPVASDDGLNTRTSYEQFTVPAYCLVDRQGFIRARYRGMLIANPGLETMIEALLEQGHSRMFAEEV